MSLSALGRSLAKCWDSYLTSQPTYNVGWDVATAKSQHGDDKYALYTTPVRQHGFSNLDKPQYILNAGIITCVDNYGLKVNALS